VDGVEEPHGERELIRGGRFLQRVDRDQAAARCSGEPGMCRDGGIVRSDAMGVRGDDRRDLEREGARVGVRPERGVAARVFDREREREPAVRKRDGLEPVTQLGRLR
jgi:hypothetical protein